MISVLSEKKQGLIFSCTLLLPCPCFSLPTAKKIFRVFKTFHRPGTGQIFPVQPFVKCNSLRIRVINGFNIRTHGVHRALHGRKTPG